MTNLGKRLVWGIGIPMAMTLATSGCATKKYVSQQIAPVNKRVTKVETATNEKIGFLNAKQERDISAVNERISTTDQKLAQVASIASEAQGTASRAMQETEANAEKIAANATAVTELGSGVANALNYQLVQNADVNFAFGKATLTPEAKKELDQVAAKVAGLPRSVVELAGFTDPIGSANFNLTLSRRRAEAVQRYLVMQKVPLRMIHIVGLGKNSPPEGMQAELETPNPTKAQLHQAARRVHIRVFGAGDITQGTASRIQ